MWVRKDPVEIRRASDISRKKRWRNSIFLGVTISFLGLFFHSGAEGMRNGACIVQSNHIGKRLPMAVVMGLCSSIFFYRFAFNKKAVICLKCGRVKNEDQVSRCSCGGDFQDLDDYEWHEK